MGQTLRSTAGGAWVVCGIRPSAFEGGLVCVELLRELDLHSGHAEKILSLTGPAYYAFCEREHIANGLLR
jgi:hypothetical protein